MGLVDDYRESPIFIKTYALLLWINNHTGHFPKSERFRLAKRIEDTAYDFQSFLLRAVTFKKEVTNLHEADIKLNQLRFLIRLSKDSHLTTQPQYEYVMGLIIEIGKLLGAWIKHTNQSVD